MTKIFIGIFAGFLLLNVSDVTTQWQNGVPNVISNSSYFQNLDNAGTVPIQGMSQEYYDYINNWHNYKNVTPVALEKKSAGSTATSPYTS